MSRQRHSREVRWWDESGREYVSHSTIKGPGSLGAIPRAARLVDIHDPAGHFLAVLAINGGAPPVVLTPGHDYGPSVVFVLLPEGLAAALTSIEDGRPMVGYLGTPRSRFPIGCRDCHRDYELDADNLQLAAASARRGRPARLIVPVRVVTDADSR